MTARRIREWPRAVAAGLLLAILLVVIGVVAASASTGGSSGSTQIAALQARNSHQAAALARDQQTLGGLRSQLAATSTQLSLTRSELLRSRARSRCWRLAALHRAAKRTPNCAVVS